MKKRSYRPDKTLTHEQVLASMTEEEWLKQVKEMAVTFGWAFYHPWLSRFSERGFPDITLVRERVVFAELKTVKGKLTLSQQEWIDRLARAGAEVYVWRPTDAQAVAEVLRW